MTDSSAFGRLLDQQRSDRERERLHNLRHDLKLPADDPVWALLSVVEDFCRSILERNERPHESAAANLATTTSRSNRSAWSAVLSIAVGGLVATTLMATSFYAGYAIARSPTPSWFDLDSAGDRPLLSLVLTIPAGWILFAQALPLFAYLAHCGWRVRKTDPALGWSMMGASAISAFGTATAVYILLGR